MCGTNKPNSQYAAGRQAECVFMRYRRRLCRSTMKRRGAIARNIASKIWRFNQIGVYRWKQTHLENYLDDIVAMQADSTYREYCSVVRDLLRLTGRESMINNLNGRLK